MSDVTNDLLALYNKALSLKTFKVSTANGFNSHKFKLLAGKKHSDYSYSLFCQDEAGSVIYLWIVPSWRYDMGYRVIEIIEQALTQQTLCINVKTC